MLIVCPNCATSYDVDVATLRPSGRRVRCVRCRTVWDAELPHAEKLLAAASALAPAPLTADVMPPPAAAAAPPLKPPPAPAAAANTSPDETPLAPAAIETPISEPALELSPGAAPAADFSAADAAALEVDSPPIVPADVVPERPAEAESATEPGPPPLEDIETVAARRQARNAKGKGSGWLLSRLQWAILALIVVNAIIVGWRADFVRAMPQTASFYALVGLPVNLRGLKFEQLTTATEQHEAVPILVIEGDIVNATGKPKDVPHLRFAVRNAARQEVYSWTAAPPRNILPPGESIAFHTRLASPPPDAHDVLVRFVNRYDIVTGTH